MLEALNANQQLDMLRVFGPKYGLDPDNVVQSTLALPEWPALNSEIYMHTVVPNLKRLGLITERLPEAGLSFTSHLFATTFFVLTGFHGMHVTGGVIYNSCVLAACLRGRYGAKHVEIAGLYWHFVDLVWILIFTFVYLI